MVQQQAACPATELLQSFLQVQQQRAQHYSRFSLAFKRFLDTRQEGPFKATMTELTSAFSGLSQQVLALEAALRDDCQRPDLAALLRTVQEHERDKLRLTLSLQALKQAHAFKTFSWQHPEHAHDDDIDPLDPVPASEQARAGLAMLHLGHSHHQSDPAAAMDTEDTDVPDSDRSGNGHGHASNATSRDTDAPNGNHHVHGHGCGCGHRHGQNTEPTELEYNAAVQEAIQLLDRCVVGINDVLEEVRYAVAEAAEAD